MENQNLRELVEKQAERIADLETRCKDLESQLSESRIYHLKSTTSLQKQIQDLLDIIDKLKTPDPHDEIVLIRQKFRDFQEQLASRDKKIHVLQKEARESAEIHFRTNLQLTKEIEDLRKKVGNVASE